MKQCHCCIWYLGQALGHTEWKRKIHNISDSHHWRYSSFTQQITLCFIYCFWSLWAFCQAVLLLTYYVATKIWSCLVLDHLHIIHVLGFITPNFLPICCVIVAALAIFQAWIWMCVGIGKCLIFIQVRHMVRLFELWCEYNLIRREFKKRNLCICRIFCIYGLRFINPLSEFCNIHLNFTAVVRHHEVYWEWL